MIFMIISMFTDQWIYMFSGSVPSVLAGAFGIFFLIQQYRKTDEEEA